MTAGRTVNSQSKDWGTPKKYVDAIRYFFDGQIDLDPCSNEYSIVHAMTEYLPEKKNGLKESWNFKRIYVNPPYGANRKEDTTIKDWIHRCDEANKRYGSEVIALIPVAPNTRHWKEHIWGKAAAVCFLYDTRLRFLVNGRDEGKGAPMACAIVYWGGQYEKFYDIFNEFGAVVDLRSIMGKTVGKMRQISQLLLAN